MLLLGLNAYISSLEAVISKSWDIIEILVSLVFIWAQEVQDYVKASLRKSRLKRPTPSYLNSLKMDNLAYCRNNAILMHLEATRE